MNNNNDNLEELAKEFAANEKKIVRSKEWQDKLNKANSEIAKAKIAAGTFVSGALKYDELTINNFYETIINWFIENPDAIFLQEYFFDENTPKTIPYGSLKMTYGRHESSDDLHDALKSMLEVRIFKAGWSKTKDANLTKFALMHNYNWKEKTEQDVTVSTKEVKFDFPNPELRLPEKEEENE